ncbi:hypothetical protein P7L66_13130 [Tistrella mobilis]|uniref:hypothetical protein n=1 Tax=Tistrella mobilis TaxID=171437 RepID=UPI00355614ED
MSTDQSDRYAWAPDAFARALATARACDGSLYVVALGPGIADMSWTSSPQTNCQLAAELLLEVMKAAIAAGKTAEATRLKLLRDRLLGAMAEMSIGPVLPDHVTRGVTGNVH